MQDTGVIAALVAAPAEAVADAGPASTESRMRQTPDNPPCWGLLVECAGLETARAVQAKLDPTTLAAHGVVRNEPGLYSLLTAVGQFDSTPAHDPKDLPQ